MPLSDYVNTFGQYMLKQQGQRVHKIAINAGFTCPNRDGSKGIGGCTFCNNSSFSPNDHTTVSISRQIDSARQVIPKRTGARRYIAYFQAYTNTYDKVEHLADLYEQALAEKDIIGLSIGTRPDCVPDEVLELLCRYRDQGHEVWLELGLQSSHDATLQKVNRGHGFSEYETAITLAQERGLAVCTHLILGLPGEGFEHMQQSLERVLALGVQGLKFHPLHIVKGTQLARQWLQGEYQPLTMDEYIMMACNLIEHTPEDVIFHRITGTANSDLLLAPQWCSKKWAVINGIEDELIKRQGYQGKYHRSVNDPIHLTQQVMHS